MLKRLKMIGLLSFKDTELELGPLNVLIGPNGSGKSNLVQVVALLQAAPSNLYAPLGSGGGFTEWIWKGDKTSAQGFGMVADLEMGKTSFHYQLLLREFGPGFIVEHELLSDSVSPLPAFQRSSTTGEVRYFEQGEAKIRQLSELSPVQSFMRERRDPEQYSQAWIMAWLFENMAIYRDWYPRLSGGPRQQHRADLPNDRLAEDASNLALVLNRLERDGSIRRIEEELQRFYPRFERFSIQVEGGYAQLFFREKGMRRLIPAARLSTGTLAFLSLLVILCHPDPPPLICLEDPEIGLHPDILAQVARLLKEASQRTQLIVTTHSDALIDALSETPESVVVTERDFDNQTQFRRLSQADLAEWLQDYRLGQLWRKGELGGTPW